MFSTNGQEKKEETIHKAIHELELDGIHLLVDSGFRATHLREALFKVMKEEHNDENLVFLVTMEAIYVQYKGDEHAARDEINLALRDVVKKFIVGDAPVINLPAGIRALLLEKYAATQELTFADLLPAVKEIKALVDSDVITRCRARVLAADCEHARKELVEHKDNILAALDSYKAHIEEDKQRGRYHKSASLRQSLGLAQQMTTALHGLDEKTVPEKLEKEFVSVCREHALKQHALYQKFKEKEMSHGGQVKADYAMHKAERVSSLLEIIQSYGVHDASHISFFPKVRRYGVEAPGMFLTGFNGYAVAATDYLKYVDKVLLNVKEKKITVECAQEKIKLAEKKIHSFMQQNFLQQRVDSFLKTRMDHHVSKDELEELNTKIMAASKLAKKVSEGVQKMYAGAMSDEDIAAVQVKARDIMQAFSDISEKLSKSKHLAKQESAFVLGK